MKALSIDLGGTHVGCAVVDESTVLASRSISSEDARSLEAMMPMVEQTLHELLTEAGVEARECEAVAMGFPGIVDTKSGAILSTLRKYEDATGMNLAAEFERAFDLPLYIENDARMALLGEHYGGTARGCDDVVMMILGTGIGTAVMMQGHLLRGAHGQAGCLGGHLPIRHKGRLCVCGNLGCAESEASGWALPQIVKARPEFQTSSLAVAEDIHFGVLFAAAAAGDALAQAIREHCLQVWAMTAVALIHAYDPEVLVLSGGVLLGVSQQILSSLQEYIARHAWTSWGQVEVRHGQLAERAAMLGAIPLIREQQGA